MINVKHPETPMAHPKTGVLAGAEPALVQPRVGPTPAPWTEEQEHKGKEGAPSMVPDYAEQQRAKERAHAAEGPHKSKAGKKFKVTILSTEVREAERNSSPIKLMVNGEFLEVPRNQELILDESWLEALKNSEFGQDVRAFPA